MTPSISSLRERFLRDEPLTLDEMRTLLASIRRGYRAAIEPKTKARTPSTATKVPKSSIPQMSRKDFDEEF